MESVLAISNILVITGFAWVIYLTIRYRLPGVKMGWSLKEWKRAGVWGYKTYRSEKQGLVLVAWTYLTVGLLTSGVIHLME